MISVINKVLSEINEKDLRYIHFKSNEHLQESFDGDTDFDVLVDSRDYSRFVEILEINGFRLYRSVGKQAYIGVFDYIYLDVSGKMIHFHLHTLFLTGTKFLKEYHIPIEEEMLDSAVLDNTGSIKIVDPSIELCTLWIRFFSKTSRLRFWLKRGRIGKGFLQESEWLIPQTKEDTMLSFLRILFPGNERFCKLFVSFSQKSKKSIGMTYRLLKQVRRELKKYKTTRLVGVKYLMRRFMMISRYLAKKNSHKPIPYRRVLLKGGVIIAIVGCDGAGKSTVNSEIKRCINRKADVYFEYFGSGDGHCYWYRYPLLLIHKCFSSSKSSDNGDSQKNTSQHTPRKIALSKAIWAILLASEKKSKLRKIGAAKAKGMIVLCDRYPQTQFVGINDGPLLFPWIESKSRIKRKIARWERQIYESAMMNKPDLVIKLMITEEVSQKRKPKEKLERIRSKISLMERLEIPARLNIVVDATNELEVVLKDVYNSISKCISNT